MNRLVVMSVNAAAYATCKTKDTIREGCRTGRLDCYKIGKSHEWTVLVPEEAIVPSWGVMGGVSPLTLPALIMEKVAEAVECGEADLTRVKGEIVTLVSALKQ
jgi:hypothetical protein